MASVDSATRRLSQETLTFEPAVMVSNAREELSPKLIELSNLDQINDFYVSIALFYSTPANSLQGKSSVNVGGVLRSALEELLAHYPWAAGRMRVNKHEQRLEVECNGKGVQFVTAHADMAFSELGNVSSPHPSLDLLFPSLIRQGDEDPPLVAIQVTRFICGGFTLSLKNNHALMDGYAAAVFLQNLCSIARGAGLLVPPDHVSRRERMKPRTPPSPTFQHPYILKKGVELEGSQYFGNARMYAFTENALEKLRRRILSSQALALSTTCSRFHALAALLWTARAKSLRGGRLPPSQELSLRVPVNVRERIVPTITRRYMGNATYQAIVRATVRELIESPLPFHVHKIKSAIANVTSESVQSQTDYIEVLGAGAHLDHSLIMPMLSLVSLPFYDTDCGWGCPMYCCVPCRQDSNRIVILDGRGSWNVLVVFESKEERVLFQEAIEEYIIVS